jgi:methylase of polypeptide subunit release factors
MAVGDLLRALGYDGSPNFLQGKDLVGVPGYSYVFRRAASTCQLRGVYTLNEKSGTTGSTVIPLIYVCEAADEAGARDIHQRVWNQNVAPFVIVQTANLVRLYSGFQYARPAEGQQESTREGVLRAAIAFNQVSEQLADFRSEAIDDGTLWRQWEAWIKPEKRVDWQLLENLERLGSWLRGNHLHKETALALIGKYVYLRYLRDRDILSDHKFEEWGLSPASVFGRKATLAGLRAVVRGLEEWLNGDVFPLELTGSRAPGPEHIRRVAGAFVGDDPIGGQMHLDFEAYDFSHIPVETLSVIYEQFLHAEGKGKDQGAYYTPVPLVDFMLQELEDRRPLQPGMKVFDASCGSGAFLVQCYRRLVEQELSKSPKQRLRPVELRGLLVDHIFGMDSDEDACRVAELSLVLTMLDYIEPPDLRTNPSFKLPVLHNTNIICKDFFAAGPDAPVENGGKRFDWIVGNPPWVEVEAAHPSDRDRNILQWIRAHKKQYPTGGNQAAEAFAWKVPELLSPDGAVALLLPAMTLFKYESAEFRRKFFGRFDVWCVANFANLAEVLFAGRSRVPAAAFFYALQAEKEEVDPGQILTYAPFVANQEASRPADWATRKETWNLVVNAGEVRSIPQADAAKGDQLTWKVAMWGSPRDERLITVLRKRFPSLKDFARDRDICISEGFQLRRKGTKGVEFVPELVGKNILRMGALRLAGPIFSFPAKALGTIAADNAYIRKRGGRSGLKVCAAPHVIVDAARRFAVYTDEYLVIPPRQIGVAGPTEQAKLLKALSLFLVSDFATYYQFFASPGWGVKRERATLRALKEIPTPFGKMSDRDLQKWCDLHAEVVAAPPASAQPTFFDEHRVGQRPWSELEPQLNEMVYAALELSGTERWLVEDHLQVKLHLDEGRLDERAVRQTTPEEMLAYAKVLQDQLDGFLDSTSATHEVGVVYDASSGAVAIKFINNGRPANPETVEKADERAAGEFQKARRTLRKKHSQWLYFDRNLLVFQGHLTVLFKPLQRFHWTRSQALADADEIIAATLTCRED